MSDIDRLAPIIADILKSHGFTRADQDVISAAVEAYIAGMQEGMRAGLQEGFRMGKADGYLDVAETIARTLGPEEELEVIKVRKDLGLE